MYISDRSRKNHLHVRMWTESVKLSCSFLGRKPSKQISFCLFVRRGSPKRDNDEAYQCAVAKLISDSTSFFSHKCVLVRKFFGSKAN